MGEPRTANRAREPKKKGAEGRRKIKIDREQVYKLAQIGCTVNEICDIVDCSPMTLHRRFQKTMHEAQSNLKARLRKKQISIALEGDKTMLIWLGKQMLGQLETPVANINILNANGESGKSGADVIEIWEAQTRERLGLPAAKSNAVPDRLSGEMGSGSVEV